MAVFGIKCVNSKVNTIKTLGVNFSCNDKLNMEKNFLTAILDIQNFLKTWRMRNLTLEGKITVFKTLTLSKIVHLCPTSVVPKHCERN